MENTRPQGSLTSKLVAVGRRYKLLLILLVVLVLILVAFYAVYRSGYNNGYSSGKKKAESVTNAFSDLIKNPRSPYRTANGEIEALDGNTLTMNTSQGKREQFTTTDKTKVTQKATTLKLDDLKVGQIVTVFLDSQNDAQVTRIVVRESTKP